MNEKITQAIIIFFLYTISSLQFFPLSEQIEKKEKVQNQPHVDFAPPVAREGVEPSTSGL